MLEIPPAAGHHTPMPKAKTILTRIVFGLVMIAAVTGLLVVDHLNLLGSDIGDARGLLLCLAVIVLIVLAFREIARLARAAGRHGSSPAESGGILPVSGLAGAIVLGTMPVWCQIWRAVVGKAVPLLAEDIFFLLGAVVTLVFLEQMIRHRVEGALARVSATLLAVVYLGAGAALMLAIRMDERLGVPALVLFLAAVKCTDIGAYFTGTAFGRHKLIPWLSPGKTWEGLAGGLAAAAGVSMLAVWAFRSAQMPQLHNLSYAQAAVFGVVVGGIGQFGDLSESLLKRSAQVKDSGSLVPEFGGVLDILDSPLLAAPPAYVLLAVMG
jgi:phosphatidate cytidylyltransferase